MFSQLPCFMYLTTLFFLSLTLPIPSALWKCSINAVAVKEADAMVPYSTPRVYLCLGNGTAVTGHISMMELQSLLLSLYARQASVCSRSNSTFVTLKLTLRRWDFFPSFFSPVKSTEYFSNSTVHWLPWKCSVEIQRWSKSSLLSPFINNTKFIVWL